MAIDINLPFAQSLISEGKARGYNDMQISQILGSAMQENSLRTDGNPGDGGSAFGGFQWRLDREKALRDKAAAAGVEWTDPSLQARHYYEELDGPESRAGKMIRAATTPEEAQAGVISSLRPRDFTWANPQAGHGWANRLANGNQAYAALTGGQYTPPADAPAPGAVPAEGQQPSAMAQAFSASTKPAQAGSAWDTLSKYLNGGKQWNAADALQGAGIAAMARDNAAGASAMAAGMNAQTAANKTESKSGMVPGTFNKATGSAVFLDKDGNPVSKQIANPFKELTAKEMETFNERQEKIGEMDALIREGDKYRNLIAEGKINLGAMKQGETFLNNITGQSTEEDRNAGEYWRYLERMRNAALRLNKGVQTEGDAQRAMNEYISGSGRFDNAQSIKALDNILKSSGRAANSMMSAQETVLNTYGDQAPRGTYRDDYKRYRSEYEGFDTTFAPKRDAYFRSLDATRNAPQQDVARPGAARGGSAGASGGSLRDKIRRDNGL